MSAPTADQACRALENALSELKRSLRCVICQDVIVCDVEVVQDVFHSLTCCMDCRRSHAELIAGMCFAKSASNRPLSKSLSVPYVSLFFLLFFASCVLCAFFLCSFTALWMSRKQCITPNALKLNLDFNKEFASLTVLFNVLERDACFV